MKYAFVRARGKQFAIKRMCQILKVSRSGYYDWRDRQESERSRRDRVLYSPIAILELAVVSIQQAEED